MCYPLQKLISGGQTGVDQVGLRVARAAHCKTGGTAPKGYLTDEGPNFELRDVYGLEESWSADYAPRTIKNVRDAQMTVWFGDPTSPGGKLTLRVAEQQQNRTQGTAQVYQVLVNPNAYLLKQVIENWDITILNVAGNRLRTNPEATKLATAVLIKAFDDFIPF